MIAPSSAMSLDLYLSSLALPDDVPCCTSVTSGRMSDRRPLCQAGPFRARPPIFPCYFCHLAYPMYRLRDYFACVTRLTGMG